MSFVSQLLQKIDEDPSGRDALQYLSSSNQEDFSELLAAAWKTRQENFEPILNCFYPADNFPAISITGDQCALQCKHCNKHYLTMMISAETPTKLWEICKKLDSEGKLGCLLSGGYNQEAMLPFTKFISTIKRIKEKTKLVLNVHTGLVNEEIARQLGEVGVDIVSFDMVGDSETIQNIYGLRKTPEDYLRSLQFLKKSGIPNIVPHICIGLNQGVLSGEIRALKLIKSFNPNLIVLLGLIPTINTPMQQFSLQIQDLAKMTAITRLLFPTTPLSLGCMRPGKKIRNQIDQYAIQAGINRIEIPTPKAMQYAIQQGLRIQKFSSCCAVPLELI
jgi:uncharacterized radical SAM superfamily protein